MNGTVKAVVGDSDTWELDVLGLPYGGPVNGRDSQGEYFSPETKFHEDKFSLPPVVYYHGYTPEGQPAGEPVYIGKTVSREPKPDGVWYRVVLDRGNEYAQRIWDAAKRGVARASSGAVSHLVRTDPTGHIRQWPVAELSLLDAEGTRQPANTYAVAMPALKAIYEQAGIAMPEAAAAFEGAAAEASPASDARPHEDAEGVKASSISEVKEMEASEVKQLVQDAINADREAREAEAQKKAESETINALKAENAQLREEAAKARRLPSEEVGAPFIGRYGFTRAYDHIDPADHALAVAVQEALHRRGASRDGRYMPSPSDNFIKALALKVESEAKADKTSAEANSYLKAAGLKANEIHYSTLATHGDEWVGVLYSNRIWEQIRAEAWVLGRLEPFSDQIPDGYESDVVPLESTDPTWYKVAQAADLASGRPGVTVTASQLSTGKKAVTLAKMGCRGAYSGEMAEDSLVAFAEQLRRQIVASGLEAFEHAILDGDTATDASTNINDIAGTPAGTEVFLLADGFRKLALVTNTANSRSGGTLTEDDVLETVKLMGTGGVNALDITKITIIPDVNTYWKMLGMSTVKTKDVYQNATLESGQLARLYGYEVKPSGFMHYLSSSRKANSAGKVDQDTAANNAYGAILAVRWDQWRLKWKRRMTIETDRWPESDTNQIVAMVRWGLGYRDTEASAISYGITL